MKIGNYEIKPYANLQVADLQVADLRGANLRGVDLQGANLQGANLQGADLQGVDLRVANLLVANLQGANLQGAKLRGANLRGANLPAFQIPQEGELIVWKKVQGGIVKLRVPADARRTISLVGRKCRAEFVEVLETTVSPARGMHDGTEYKAGETVRPDKYDDDIRVECTHGIHFFLTKEEAESYY